jgi:hypothetical protein
MIALIILVALVAVVVFSHVWVLACIVSGFRLGCWCCWLLKMGKYRE